MILAICSHSYVYLSSYNVPNLALGRLLYQLVFLELLLQPRSLATKMVATTIAYLRSRLR